MTTVEARKLLNKAVVLYYKGGNRMILGVVVDVVPRNIQLDIDGMRDWIYLPDIHRYQVVEQPA